MSPLTLSPVRTQLELFDLCKRTDALLCGATDDIHQEASGMAKRGYEGVVYYVRTGDMGTMEQRLLKQAKHAGTCRENAPWPTADTAESGWVYLVVGAKRSGTKQRAARRRSQSLAPSNRANTLRTLHNSHNAPSVLRQRSNVSTNDTLTQSVDAGGRNVRHRSTLRRRGGSNNNLDSSDGSSEAASVRCPACGHAFHVRNGSVCTSSDGYDRV